MELRRRRSSFIGLLVLVASSLCANQIIAADDDESNGYIDRPKEVSAQDRIAERKVAAGLMNWIVGDTLSGFKPNPSPKASPTSQEALGEDDRTQTAIKRVREDQQGKFVGDLVVAFLGVAFFGQPGRARSAAEERTFQQDLFRKTLDRDGFIIAKVARELTSLSGARLLCIYITGTRTPTVPPLLVHPILDDEARTFADNPHELIMKWAGVARKRISRSPDLPSPGRWDFRPVVISTDGPVEIVYPAALKSNMKDRPEELPGCLKLIRLGSAQTGVRNRISGRLTNR